MAQDHLTLDVKSLAAERDQRLRVWTQSALQSIHGHLRNSWVPERHRCAPRPGCLASPFSSVRGWRSSPLGAGAALCWGWTPRSGWRGWHSTSFLSEVSESPRLTTPGGFHWQQEPEAKPMLSSSWFQIGNHTEVPAGTLPKS